MIRRRGAAVPKQGIALDGLAVPPLFCTFALGAPARRRSWLPPLELLGERFRTAFLEHGCEARKPQERALLGQA